MTEVPLFPQSGQQMEHKNTAHALKIYLEGEKGMSLKL